MTNSAVADDDDDGDDWGVEGALMILLKPMAMAMASDGYGSCPGVGIAFVYVVVVVVVVVFRMGNWNRGGGGGHWNGRWWSHTNKVVRAASSRLNGVRSPCPANLSVLSYLVSNAAGDGHRRAFTRSTNCKPPFGFP